MTFNYPFFIRFITITGVIYNLSTLREFHFKFVFPEKKIEYISNLCIFILKYKQYNWNWRNYKAEDIRDIGKLG